MDIGYVNRICIQLQILSKMFPADSTLRGKNQGFEVDPAPPLVPLSTPEHFATQSVVRFCQTKPWTINPSFTKRN